MGHWSEGLVDELAQMLGGEPDREVLTDLISRASSEVELLAGRAFHPVRPGITTIESNGLPFADVPDIHIGSSDSVAKIWEIPDPVKPEIATVLQISALDEPVTTASSPAVGLWIAGLVVAEASRQGRLSRDYVVDWLGSAVDRGQLTETLRWVMDPAVRFNVPVLTARVDGWWIQIARRLLWVTNKTENDGRLLEPVFDDALNGQSAAILAAVEPILIAAPMTRQPAEWAFSARIWPGSIQRKLERPWSKISRAIHSVGIPTITLDSASAPAEIACQVVLKGYWHGYIGSEGSELANAVAMAYPQQVASIQRTTRAPSRVSAAATLLEQLLHPGFDPARGAEATRRYVRRKASIAIMEHRKREAPDRYPWTQVGISERRYYKLLPLFAQKINGRYDIDHDDVVSRMKAHLNDLDRERATRAAALKLLESRGFSREAARKWLQRHSPKEALEAQPRTRRAMAAGLTQVGPAAP